MTKLISHAPMLILPTSSLTAMDSGEIQEEDPREHLNLVFIGHVDAGKSTMSGQLLYLTGQVCLVVVWW